jgi:hypothetical protein
LATILALAQALQVFALSLLGRAVAHVGLRLAVIGRLFAFVGGPISYVGDPIAFICHALTPRELVLAPGDGFLALGHFGGALIGFLPSVGTLFTGHQPTVTPRVWNTRLAGYTLKRNSTTSPSAIT